MEEVRNIGKEGEEEVKRVEVERRGKDIEERGSEYGKKEVGGRSWGIVRKRMKRGSMEEGGRYGKSWRRKKLDVVVFGFLLFLSVVV